MKTKITKVTLNIHGAKLTDTHFEAYDANGVSKKVYLGYSRVGQNDYWKSPTDGTLSIVPEPK